MAGAEVGDQAGIDRVGFGAHLLGDAVSLDPSRIDPAHGKTGIRPRFGHGFPINARGFHADVCADSVMVDQPRLEFGQARVGVGNNFAASLTIGQT